MITRHPLRALQPDHQHGYTETYLIVNLTETEWDQFTTWMHGQGYMVDHGESVYFTHDFERWLDGMGVD